ncbi:PLP-dependent cysteine synthase family protein [Caldisericum exile]|uniref:cysteine synthase n=1 Tax=Caldisericum exile (strain DSM 21853 / NBRC 104410 / AZM16c01) TaxID=511051 RepID=A0A7U6GFL7_CALEA|nr:cysteine synthase [Caldisericum exile]BAL81510.1 cysteine synthase [Caldisericum exile AZM16c01]
MKKMLDIIGNTPIVALKENPNIFVKLEYLNPFGSIKDRPAYFMLKDALADRRLSIHDTIVEPTSGNTGIALSALSKFFGISIILTMPDNLSKERLTLMKSFGARVVLTDKSLGMNGAIEEAKRIIDDGVAKLMLNQFGNPSNPKAHELTTAYEILKDMNFDIDAFVAGIGTGGTITGVGRTLKKFIKKVKIIGVEPEESPYLTKGIKGTHSIEGIGAGFKPEILDLKIIDEVITIKSKDAREFTNELALKESIFGGPSTGANVLASKIVKEKYGFKRVVTIAPDRGERYFSEDLFG